MKAIPNFPNYCITKDGRVWSKKRKGRWLKYIGVRGKYLAVNPCNNGKPYTCYVHRLVLETYVGPCPDGMECRHLDGNKQNNNLSNLKWGTSSENTQDAIKHGTHQGLKNI